MNEKASNNHSNSKDYQPARPVRNSSAEYRFGHKSKISNGAHRYSRAEELVNNLPYAAMAMLGAAIFVIGFQNPVCRWAAASAYLVYAVAGAFWIMIFLCPYCARWNTMNCPCGYSRIAARLRQKSDSRRFREKFKRHIPVIVPLWFIPILAGVPLVVRSFSWLLLVLLIVFALVAFVVLPLFSTKYGCADCPERNSCPWMGRKSQRKKD